MEIRASLRTFAALILLIVFCVVVGFVSGFLVSSKIFYEKGQMDMLDLILTDENEKDFTPYIPHTGKDIIGGIMNKGGYVRSEHNKDVW